MARHSFPVSPDHTMPLGAGSYAEMVRQDAEADSPDKPCAFFYYESTGLEIDPIMAICHCIVDKTLNKGGINRDDTARLQTFFNEYKGKHPQDKEAQKISSDDIAAVAEFLMEYERVGTDFLDITMESPDDKVIEGVAQGGIHRVSQYMEGKYRDNKTYFDTLMSKDPKNDVLKQVAAGGRHSIFRFVRKSTKSAVQECLKQ
jgi:hypothetical protein